MTDGESQLPLTVLYISKVSNNGFTLSPVC